VNAAAINAPPPPSRNKCHRATVNNFLASLEAGAAEKVFSNKSVYWSSDGQSSSPDVSRQIVAAAVAGSQSVFSSEAISADWKKKTNEPRSRRKKTGVGNEWWQVVPVRRTSPPLLLLLLYCRRRRCVLTAISSKLYLESPSLLWHWLLRAVLAGRPGSFLLG
jgi:hypothetical protein